MPDLLTVSGESVIRNFLTGAHTTEKYGGKMWKYGYLNDIFGHIAQMPQILNGFGIEGAYLGRGAGCRSNTDYLWISPDGSECYICKQCYADLLKNFKTAEDKDAAIKEFIKEDEAASFLNYTFDHAVLDEDAFDFYDRVKKLSEKYDITEGLENSVDEMKKEKNKLPILFGELIKTGKTIKDFRAVTHSLSSYFPIKKENDYCEQLMEEIVSPVMVMAELGGKRIEKSFYDLAYKYLLKNQPHDSICGCSIDTVHSDMSYGYSQIKSISDAILEDFLDNNLDEKTDNMQITVYNTNLKEKRGIILFDIIFDKKWQGKSKNNTGYQEVNTFQIVNENGESVEYQIIDIEKDYIVSVGQEYKMSDKYAVAVDTNLPGFGSGVFKILPEKNEFPFVEKISNGRMSAENEYIAIEIEKDGTVTLIDKETGKTYRGLNEYVDDTECGNGWFHESALCNDTIISKGFECSIQKVLSGNLLTKFQVSRTMRVPKKMDFSLGRRVEETCDIKIVTTISLAAHSKYVEFETEIHNFAEDHRMRVEFPTGIDGYKYFSSQAFCYVERDRGITEEGSMFREPEAYEKNTSGVICVSDKENSLSFIGKQGFHEAAVSCDGTISATLFRSFGRVMPQAIKSELAQLKGKMIFNYAVSTEKNRSKLLEIKSEIASKQLVSGKLTDESGKSLFELESDNIISSIVKRAENENGIIIRLYNPGDREENGILTINADIKRMGYVSLSEENFEPIDISKEIKLVIPPYKIISIYVEAGEKK